MTRPTAANCRVTATRYENVEGRSAARRARRDRYGAQPSCSCTIMLYYSMIVRCTVTPHEPSCLSPRARRPSYRRRADALKRLPEKIQEGAAKRARAAPARETWEAPSVSELFHFRTRPSSYPILSQPWLLRTVSAGPAPLTPGGHCVLQEAEAACELKVVLGKKCSEKHEVTMIRRS